ncbi:hypothetical protein L1049_027641 [Liquidambar formosana]|uniref:EDS1 EP domain-containing protein n=1 Tax=Liquidambar formosana TaxID=63359 RepID=A0AAP0RJ43_LIQFO
MLKRYELPDGFEGRERWIDLGTRFRRILEPLDIANFYRHSKNEETGAYLEGRARPKRYRYTQRWLEHAKKKPVGFYSESCFWAEVEEQTRKLGQSFDNKIVQLEKDILRWVGERELGMDVFLEESTFVKWWNKLPQQHRSGSCIAMYMNR